LIARLKHRNLGNYKNLEKERILYEIMKRTINSLWEFREVNRRIEVGDRWSDEGVERVAGLLEDVRFNETKLEF
jgi:hypothetical protein